jgi:hypothetical protein
MVGVVGALIAALLVYQVFVRSGDATPKALGPTPAGVAIDGTTTTTAPQEPTLPNGSFNELSLRDPFEPPTRQTPSGPTSTTSITTTTTQPGTIPTTPTSSPQQNPAPTTDVALLDVYTANGVQTARIRVGNTEYQVVVGQAFAGNYKLVSFDGATCVNLTYADSPFRLCQGEQVTK